MHSIASSLAEQLQHLQSAGANSERVFVEQVASGVAQGRFDEKWPPQLLELMNTSHHAMRLSSSSTELNALREIYTICCILRGILLLDLLQFHEAISSLDHAIIIAGAPGKLDFVLHCIREIQSKMLQETLLGAPSLSVQLCHYTPKDKVDTVPSIHPPSFLSFQSKFSKSPFILRNYAHDWPAMQERPWRSAAYLRSIAGPGRVVPVEIGHDYRSETWKQKIMPWDQFLSTLNLEDQPISDFAGNVLYLAQHDLTVQFPSLRDDISIPDYVYASLTSSDCPNYRQPRNDDNVLFNTWLGPQGTMSPAHTDPYYNFYGAVLVYLHLRSNLNPPLVQVVGHKSVWLAPPSASPFMHPISNTAESHRTVDRNENQLMGNTSEVDVFADASNDITFSDFKENVVPISMTARLGPGDVLFFPPGWWHAMRSETTSFSFSMWF